ncbi:MFS transporter [Liquorilactobacillus satsumensis]|uniref:MFS transporter n=1 Tax=Liquorilactobacillus satsumensis TaxID=259059 RepID=UPI0039ED7A85
MDTNNTSDYTVSNKELIKVTASGWLGTAMDFMDFQLYSLAAAIVFNKVFFANDSPAMGLVMSMGTYGAGYCARLLGAWFFGRLGDKIGRRDVLFFTISLMGLASTGIGFLPTYAQVGIWAPVGLVSLRILQGFGAGAEISGASVMTVEFAKKKNRGFTGSFICLGTASGTLLASLIWTIILDNCSKSDLYSWGWRIPFYASFLIMAVAILIRIFIKESPTMAAKKELLEKERSKEVNESKETIKTQKSIKHKATVKNFLISAGLRFGQAGNSGLMQTYLAGFLVTYIGVKDTVPTKANIVSSLIAFLTIPLVGWIGDKISRRLTYMILSLSTAVFAIPMMLLINSHNTILITIALIIGLNTGVQGLSALENVMLPELFGSIHRMTLVSLSKEIAGLISVGFGPVIAAAFVTKANGSWWPIALMIIFFSLVTFISAKCSTNTNQRNLNDLDDPM